MFRRSCTLLILALVFVPAAAVGIEDPTRPANYSSGGVAVEPRSLRSNGTEVLQALLNGGGRKVAVISGELLQEGQGRGGMQVLEIKKHSVVIMDRQGNAQELVLTKDIKGLK